MKKTLNLFLIFWLILAGQPLQYVGASELPGAAPQVPQAWPAVALVQVAAGFASPVHITHAGDGSGRLFIVEQAGRIKILLGGQISGVFLDIAGRVLSPANGGGGEQGLLSVAFPPSFGNGIDHFYVYYTNQSGDNQLSRFSISTNPDLADPASEEILLVIPHPGQRNHNGGQLAFGPDGYLYIGTGDGGGGGDPQGNAQNLTSLLGKLLRIDVDPVAPIPTAYKVYLPSIAQQFTGSSDPPRRYLIPKDNPFLNDPTARPEIWAFGLRNPWRFSFDRQTGDIWIGDVGQNNWEEIDFQPANSLGGENYGWNIMEGEVCYADPNCSPTGFTPPVQVYDHSNGNCAVTGGMVYHGSTQPALQGIYFYGDYCTGNLWGLRWETGAWQNTLLLDSHYRIASFGENEAGELFLADINGGVIYQVVQN
jgi:glucose/arabinose dehydrogenase